MNLDIGSIYMLTEDLHLKSYDKNKAEVFEKGTRLEHIWNPWKNTYHFLVLDRDDGIKISLDEELVSNILAEEPNE